MSNNAIFWFRQDFRLSDNIALTQALKNHDNVYVIYIYDKELGGKWKLGSATKWWLHHTLKALQNEVNINVIAGPTLLKLKEAARELKAKAIYANIVFEPSHLNLDEEISAIFEGTETQYIKCNSTLMFEPSNIKTKLGTTYTVFTPFWKNCMTTPPKAVPLPKPSGLDKCHVFTNTSVDNLGLLPTSPNWAVKFKPRWTPGEASAQQKLQYFTKHTLKKYKSDRNIPGTLGTSRLSPHLHFGEVSHLQVWHAVEKCSVKNENSAKYLKEIGWLEFSSYLLYYYPEITDHNFKKLYDDYKWDNNTKHFERWQKGMTGYPIVDAGMRELWATGYMHNRVRMIVASFLIKHLQIDWRKGAEWFWDTLIDADLAANSMNWQWVAGSGPDAAQYYRIFNPILQGKKFDPEGKYVRAWVSELKKVPNEYVHEPWTMPMVLMTSMGITAPKNYPTRVVDHDFARKLALQNFKTHKSSKTSELPINDTKI